MKFVGLGLLVIVVVLIGLGAWLYTPDRSEAALEERYFRGHADYRDVAGLHLHVRDTGPRDAPAVVLLHGFGSSLLTWDAWSDRLSIDHRVVRIDLPGFGLTGADPTADYSDERAGIILAELMDQLGIHQATVMGNSLGGRIAWMFAVHHPDRVAKLVLISPDGFASPGFHYGKKPDVPLLMRLLPYTLPEFMLRPSIEQAYGDPARLTDGTLTRYRDMMLAPGVRSAILVRSASDIRSDPVPLLRQIRIPTLILWGEKDNMIPFSNAADYARAMPFATVAALAGLGHVPFEEAPLDSFVPVRGFIYQSAPRD